MTLVSPQDPGTACPGHTPGRKGGRIGPSLGANLHLRYAFHRIAPRSAGVTPSQCCSKRISSPVSVFPEYVARSMATQPESVLHPRPPPLKSKPPLAGL